MKEVERAFWGDVFLNKYLSEIKSGARTFQPGERMSSKIKCGVNLSFPNG